MTAHVETADETTRSRLTYRAIAGYAEKIAERNGVVAENGHVDVRALLQQLGGEIQIDNGQESLTIRDVHDFTVHIPRHTSKLRDRFTIAHELGHYFLHFRAPDDRRRGPVIKRANRTGSNVAETQANVFASNLLMPAEQFRAAFEDADGDMREVAKIFEVSVPAAKVRASYLGLLE
ncbi:putative Xre family DNA-binding protein [Gordonia araii NBRC 100433]|uniref:Putative Xre family DNA-binding protein n=1 Tax=Gordonia araii NBRC 100433 TaxID=1073574 RepID=G7GXC0_9ACTN|nr:ImmA/IrrE family metallo-endopeptidase [Gordonia araii]NNG95967.1 ImmA/IrrE family metallo-endopeptidase [Gordonia araii NBRC 100433]GAB08245.1 putative Xre family DNA-binding protein [Gordonia araii NBRC 100433]